MQQLVCKMLVSLLSLIAKRVEPDAYMQK